MHAIVLPQTWRGGAEVAAPSSRELFALGLGGSGTGMRTLLGDQACVAGLWMPTRGGVKQNKSLAAVTTASLSCLAAVTTASFIYSLVAVTTALFILVWWR